MGYKVGSFNVRNLSKDNEKKIDIIAEIIMKEQFDIVALQEVLDNEQIHDGGLGRRKRGIEVVYESCLLRRLPNYDMRWGASNVKKNNNLDDNTDKRGEGYAFLWNTKRIELAKKITPTGEKVFNPRIWSQYSLKRADGKQRLVRNPFYGRFKIKGIKQEIRLITTHIYFGSNYANDLDLRRRELNILAGAIYPRLHDMTYGVNTPATTILLGDYNLNLKNTTGGLALSEAKSNYMNAVIIVDENGMVHSAGEIASNPDIRTFTTYQDNLSTLAATGDEERYVNNYDHFTIETDIGRRKKTFDRANASNPHAIQVCDIKREIDQEIDFASYRKYVSDHLPISIDLIYRS